MKQRTKLLNDLIVSLESQGLQVDQVTEADLAKATEDVEGAQASLESFQLAYNLLSDLHSKDVLSLESYSCIMNLTMSNVSISMESDDFTASDKFQEDALNKWRKENGQAGQEDKDSLLKRAKDKVMSAVKWLIEKVQGMFSRVGDFIKKALTGMKERTSKVTTWFKESNGLKKDVHIPVKDVYLIVEDNNGCYSASEVKGSVKFLYQTLPDVCNTYIKNVGKGVIADKKWASNVNNNDVVPGFLSLETRKLVNVLVPSGSKHAFDENELRFVKLKGTNVVIGSAAENYGDGKIISIVGKMYFGLDQLKEINKDITVETISITTREFQKLRDLAELLEDEISEMEKHYSAKYDSDVKLTLENIKKEMLEAISNSEEGDEESANAVQQFITKLVSKHLNGVFVLRAQSEQAAIQLLNCTNKLLWKVYKVETSEMSDSKEIAVV